MEKKTAAGNEMLFFTKKGAIDLKRVFDKITILESNKRSDLDRTQVGRVGKLLNDEYRKYTPGALIAALWPEAAFGIIGPARRDAIPGVPLATLADGTVYMSNGLAIRAEQFNPPIVLFTTASGIEILSDGSTAVQEARDGYSDTLPPVGEAGAEIERFKTIVSDFGSDAAKSGEQLDTATGPVDGTAQLADALRDHYNGRPDGDDTYERPEDSRGILGGPEYVPNDPNE